MFIVGDFQPTFQQIYWKMNSFFLTIVQTFLLSRICILLVEFTSIMAASECHKQMYRKVTCKILQIVRNMSLKDFIQCGCEVVSSDYIAKKFIIKRGISVKDIKIQLNRTAANCEFSYISSSSLWSTVKRSRRFQNWQQI